MSAKPTVLHDILAAISGQTPPEPFNREPTPPEAGAVAMHRRAAPLTGSAFDAAETILQYRPVQSIKRPWAAGLGV